VAESVTIGEEQDLWFDGVELAERSLEVDYSDVARVGFASSALFLTWKFRFAGASMAGGGEAGGRPPWGGAAARTPTPGRRQARGATATSTL